MLLVCAVLVLLVVASDIEVEGGGKVVIWSRLVSLSENSSNLWSAEVALCCFVVW